MVAIGLHSNSYENEAGQLGMSENEALGYFQGGYSTPLERRRRLKFRLTKDIELIFQEIIVKKCQNCLITQTFRVNNPSSVWRTTVEIRTICILFIPHK